MLPQGRLTLERRVTNVAEGMRSQVVVSGHHVLANVLQVGLLDFLADADRPVEQLDFVQLLLNGASESEKIVI